ncbi:MAG: prephenate dehydrogenase/arogenate dehydrogenase family protein [Betaproteobacteria bacterium]
MRIDKLAVVGVGLVGGSCALALKRAGVVKTVVGIGRSAGNLADALRLGVIDRAHRIDEAWNGELRDADVILLATPVAQFRALFATVADCAGPATIITDAGSTKLDVIAAARATLGAALPRFVPGHPIAGTEHNGAAAAFATLFDGRSVILTPLCETLPDATARIAALWQACGANVTTLKPQRHDAIFAAVSHLPHVLAFALVAELAARPDAAAYFEHAASGFRDFTRIAAGSPEMWRDIALANREALLAEIDRYGDALRSARAMIVKGDGDALAALFAEASSARRAWEAKSLRPVAEDKG